MSVFTIIINGHGIQYKQHKEHVFQVVLMWIDCIGCGESVDIGDEFVEAVDVVGDMDDEECGIDHGNMSGTLDPDFLNPCLKKMCTTNTTTYCSFCEGHAHEV